MRGVFSMKFGLALLSTWRNQPQLISPDWLRWLATMIPYCCLYLLIDSAVLGREINWFDAKIGHADILPIRPSAYILSLVNEQASKGGIAYYLKRRDGVPGWEVASSMLFLMFCEYYSLILWASIGVELRWSHFQEVFHVIPCIALESIIFFVIFHLFFSGRSGSRMARRERPIFHAFRLRRYGTTGPRFCFARRS